MNEMYNEDIKWKFLNDKYDSDDSKEVNKYIFYYSYLNEMALNKDLYDFNLEQIGSCIANSNPKSLNVAMSRGSIITQYISWAIENNFRRDNLNPMQDIDETWYREQQFIDESIKQYISKSELDEMVKNLVNYQDLIIPVLLFNGVYGHESSEIRNLKLSDIQEDGTTRLYDDVKGERFIKLDEDVIELIRKANYEQEYQNRNGDVSVTSRSPKSQLVESDFVVKNLKRGGAIEGNRVRQNIVINRINLIKEFCDLPDITPKSIWRSGMLYMASKLMEGKDDLDSSDINKIGDYYNLTKIVSNGYENYHTAYIRTFINKENIKKLYK